MFSTHLHSLAATLMESENSSFIDKISSQPPLAVATQQGRKDVIKACVALSFDMNSMMRIFTRKSTPLERSRIDDDLATRSLLKWNPIRPQQVWSKIYICKGISVSQNWFSTQKRDLRNTDQRREYEKNQYKTHLACSSEVSRIKIYKDY